ncbi:GDSL-type esterase/lipase family protein [Massilia sp. METH4]|uniref:GDSL-type esterase/lipase family protein n=1 Tax=Massilia sp. METH4 TaxID=3123041 RepID=UPI0030D014A1
MRHILPLLLLAAASAHAAAAGAAASDPLTLFKNRPGAGWQVRVADPENAVPLAGASAVVPKSENQPQAVVRGTAGKVAGRNALTLAWRDTWYASLRFESTPRDLRPYLDKGVVAFDLNVRDLGKGGIDFRLDCGEGCERKVPYVLPGRAAAGQGWKSVSIALKCFYREGDVFETVMKPFSVDATGQGEVAVANVRILKSGQPNTACPDYRTRSVTPEPLNESWAIDWWMPRHEEKVKDNAARRVAGKLPQLVFIGDSITEGWAKEGKEEFARRYARYQPINLGFGGDRTENILWRIRHGEVDGIDPKVVVLMAGTNNTGSRQEDPATTAAGLRRVIDELQQRLPNAKILLLGVFPRDAADSQSRRINDAINGRIAQFADNRRVFFADIGSAFLDEHGTLSKDIMPDLLHPNARGYEIWARAMDPILQPLLTGYRWGSVAIGGGGFVSAVVPTAEQGVVYARTDVGGAYRWTGDRWTPLLDWVSEDQTGLLGVDSLAVDPRDPARLYLLAGIAYHNGGRTAILRSRDYGKTFAVTDVTAQFKTHGNGPGRNNGERLAVDPGASNVLYVGTRANGLFRSDDFGATWQHVRGLDVAATPNGAGIAFVLPDPASVKGGRSERLFVGVSRAGTNLFRSDDGGRTFQPMDATPGGLMPQRAALDGLGHLYVTFANGAGPHPRGDEKMDSGAVRKYAIASGAGQDVTPKGPRAAYSGISVDRADPRRLLASTISLYARQSGEKGDAKGDRFYLSTDGGASWTDLVARGFRMDHAGVPWVKGHAIHWASTIAFDPFDPRAAWVTSGNGVFKTSNLDAVPTVWRFDVKGLEETVPLGLVSRAGAPLVSTIGDYDGFIHTDPRNYGRIHEPQMGTTFGLAYAGMQPQVLARVGKSIYVTRHGGAKWRLARGMNGTKGQLALSADGKVLLHSPERSRVTFRSTDDGDTWTTVTGLDGARPVADPVDGNRFYAYQDGAFLASADAGRTFSVTARLPEGGSDVVRAVPGRSGDVWVALRNGGLARSTNGGATFAAIRDATYAGAVGFGKAEREGGYPAVYLWGTIDGLRGIWRSTDEGANWVRINDDAHQYGGPGDGRFIVGDMNVVGRVYMSTAGRGIVYGEMAP